MMNAHHYFFFTTGFSGRAGRAPPVAALTFSPLRPLN
jgi:hypothetical protein